MPGDRFDSNACFAKIWIGRVKSNCPREFLENAFRKAGKLIKVETGFPGFAFADYDNEEDADEACKQFNKTVIEGVGEVIVSRATQRGYGDACVKRDIWQRGKGTGRPIGYQSGRSRSRSRSRRSRSSRSRSRSSSGSRRRARYRSPSSFTRARGGGARNRSESIERKYRPRSQSRSRARSEASASRSIERKFRPKHPSPSVAPDRLNLPIHIEADQSREVPPSEPRQDQGQEVAYERPPSKDRSPEPVQETRERNNRERSYDSLRERSREAPRERSPVAPRERSREAPQERSRDAPCDRSREAPRDRSREAPRDRSREPLREPARDRSRDREVRSFEAPRDKIREAPRDRSREREVTGDQSRDATRDRSRELPRHEQSQEQPGAEMVLKNRSSGTDALSARSGGGSGSQLSIRERAAVVQFFDGASARDLLLESAAVLGVPDVFVPEILNGFPHSFQGLSQEGVINLLAVLGSFVSHRGVDGYSTSQECSVEVRQSLGINAAGERVIRKTIIVDGSISCSEERSL